MGFFTNVINYIKSIDIKRYIKKIIPSKDNFNITNKFRRKKKPTRTSDAEYGFTSQNPTTNCVITTSTEGPQAPIYLEVMERKSIVAIVEPTSRLDDPTSHEEPDKIIGRPSIYTNRTQIGINKLMNHINDNKRHTIVMPEERKQLPKKPKRISHETDDLKVYILDSINEIEMIRHQIHMKSEIVKTVDCNEADLEFVKEYLTSCMMEIEDIDAKGTIEIQTAKEDALYYAKQWYNQLNAQLKVQRDAAEDVYIRVTLAQLDAVKNKINKLSSEAKTKGADNTDVIRRLSQYIDDIEHVDAKDILKIETIKRVTLQLAEELTEDIHADIVQKRTELEQSNLNYNDTQIGEDDIYDEVSITSSSDNISVHIGDSDSDDDDSVTGNAPIDNTNNNIQVRRPSQFIIPDILIDSCEVQEEVVVINTERNKLPTVHSHAKSANRLKGETPKSILAGNKLKLARVNFNNLDDEINKSGSSSSSSSSTAAVHEELQQTKRIEESPQPKRKPTKPPPMLGISHQGRLSKEELEFNYTQECLQEILLCRNRLECLADSVLSFRGTTSDDEFVFLQENITFSMLALNAIDAKGIRAVVDMKREAMMYGQIGYDDLEQRAQEVVQQVK